MKIDRKRVDALMAQRGIFRYKDLAERAGLTQKRLSVILNHGSGRPKTIIKVAKALGVFAPDLSGERRDTPQALRAAHAGGNGRRTGGKRSPQSIPDFLARKVPVDWPHWSVEARRRFWANPTRAEDLVDRDRVCALEVWGGGLGQASRRHDLCGRRGDKRRNRRPWRVEQKPARLAGLAPTECKRAGTRSHESYN